LAKALNLRLTGEGVDSIANDLMTLPRQKVRDITNDLRKLAYARRQSERPTVTR
jgi:hypothetical protein